ncbi:hypothetical protein PHYSODRAFT_331668 [Phytophthora sojae]|uniref:Uncharacterized protein n=1 Tax=Phytophthora sojae (strain P6497) TaxID=1094619 RepID=G4ZJ75_PHYSP|nr:hypothetical protein PHYSODRAFT_331668 [Phytophthora sojae]EGZ17739.1 hypothetical protein PHYSODRAFT_331668 [Phytophthora sojae]|eukprot:XP_009526797.1 hypothetical protein PHYSODRAFT_331668 [Phytophthora sojae]
MTFDWVATSAAVAMRTEDVAWVHDVPAAMHVASPPTRRAWSITTGTCLPEGDTSMTTCRSMLGLKAKAAARQGSLPLTKYCTKVLDLMHRCSGPMVMVTDGQQPWQRLLSLLGRRWRAHSLLEGCLCQAKTWQPICGLVRGRWHVYIRNTMPQRDAVATLDASRCVTLTVCVALGVREVPLVHATLLLHVALEVHEALMAVVVLYGLCVMRSCTHTDLVLVAATQDAIAGDGGQYSPHHDEVPLRYPGVEGRHLSVGDVMAVTRCRALDKSTALLCMMSGLLEAAMVAQANTTLKHDASWLWSALDHSPWVEPTYSTDRHTVL